MTMFLRSILPAYSCLRPSTTSTDSGPQVLFVLMRPVPLATAMSSARLMRVRIISLRPSSSFCSLSRPMR